MGLFDKLNHAIILKESKSSEYYISKLEELKQSERCKDKKKLDRELSIARSGKYGEDQVLFELRNSHIPMYVLHDVYIEHNGLNAQIDFVAITRKCVFLIECKNLIGDITVNNRGDFIRSYKINGRSIKEGFYSPITQNTRHMELLKEKKKSMNNNFITKKLFELNSDGVYKSVVVLANSKTILNDRYCPKEIKQNIVRLDHLSDHINDINKISKLKSFNDNDLKIFSENILNMCEINNTDYMNKFEIIETHATNNEYKTKKESVSTRTYSNKSTTAKFVETVPKNNDIIIKKPLKSDDSILEKELKKYRMKMATKEKLKAYMVFNNKTMDEIILNKPKSESDMFKISGFGKIKVEKYGEDIIKIINAN